MCKENTSVLNGVAFALLILASLLCALSFTAPFWIFYPTQHGVLEDQNVVPKYPFKMASWRGLWAVCFKQGDRYGLGSDHSKDVSLCVWFWQKDSSSWKSVPSTRYVHILSLS